MWKVYMLLVYVTCAARGQLDRKLGPFTEVFAWKQITYDINGYLLVQNRFGSDDLDNNREKRQSQLTFPGEDNQPSRPWDTQSSKPSRPYETPTTSSPNDEAGSFYIQYNNVPMGMEKVGNRLFVSLPRRRYGIPATLNYVDLTKDNARSPPLKPYPDLVQSRSLVSVYRTRADECERLWMVDTGLMEIPNNPRQVQTPAIVIFDLKTDKVILKYELKPTDVPAANTPTGLASITIDMTKGDCDTAFAYLPDLTTNGIVVYSLKDNDSWRLTHNYLAFNPIASNLNIAEQRFQWSDGIFSLTLAGAGPCRAAYFHPLISTNEFTVSTCVLKNKTIASDPNYWTFYSLLGDRGANSQSTMHDYHKPSNVMFFADIGRDAVSCWNAGDDLTPANVAVLVQDNLRMSYPSDLHVTDDEVWVIANALPRFGYSRYNTDEYNFYIYRAKVQELIAGTICQRSSGTNSRNNKIN